MHPIHISGVLSRRTDATTLAAPDRCAANDRANQNSGPCGAVDLSSTLSSGADSPLPSGMTYSRPAASSMSSKGGRLLRGSLSAVTGDMLVLALVLVAPRLMLTLAAGAVLSPMSTIGEELPQPMVASTFDSSEEA